MNLKTEVTLSEKDVQEIVKAHLLTKFKSVKDVTVIMQQEMRGYYQDEHYEMVFKGIKCEVEI